MVLSILAIVSAGLVELKRLEVARDDLNEGQLDWFVSLIAAISFVNFVVFRWLCFKIQI